MKQLFFILLMASARLYADECQTAIQNADSEQAVLEAQRCVMHIQDKIEQGLILHEQTSRDVKAEIEKLINENARCKKSELLYQEQNYNPIFKANVVDCYNLYSERMALLVTIAKKHNLAKSLVDALEIDKDALQSKYATLQSKKAYLKMRDKYN